MNRDRSALRQALHTGAGMMALHALAFVTSILVARGLGPAGQGRFQVVLSIAVFVTLLTTAGLDEAVAYLLPRYAVEQRAKSRALVTYAIGATAAVSVLIGIVFFFAAPAVERLLRIAQIAHDLRFLLLLCPALMVLSMSLAVLRGIGRADWRAYINYYFVGGIYFAAVAASFVRGLSPATVYSARIASIAAGAVIALLVIVRSRVTSGHRLDRSDFWNVHTFGGWLVFVGMFQYAIEQPLLDLMIVGRCDTAAAVGAYSVAAKVAGVIGTGSLALNVVMAPVFARSTAERDTDSLRATYRRASRWMAGVAVVVGGAVLLFHQQVLLLFGREYINAAGVVTIFAAAQIATGLLGLNAPMLIATGRAYVEFCITAAGAVTLLVGGVLLGARFGATGVAVASGAATVGVALTRRVAVARMLAQS